MIDITIIREQTERVKTACAAKNSKVDIDEILRLDGRKREVQGKLDELNRLRNVAAQEKNIEQGKALKAESALLEPELTVLEETLKGLLWKVPNMPSEDTPVGKDESENVVLRQWGTRPEFAFKAKDHETLGVALGIINKESASKVSGARFAYMLGGLVLLEQAMVQYTLSVLTDELALKSIAEKAGINVKPTPFIPVMPPMMIKPDVFEKMARLHPTDERYHLPSDDVYLIGSAEHTLGPLHMDETFKEEDLPRRYAAFTPAFRREAGSYGKDTHGLLRLHQFQKLEMESFTTAEQGILEQDFFVAIEEHINQQLGLAYQVVMTCTGDQGDPDARHIDIETWMPGEGKYRETHSADYMTDYQSRRLNTKVKVDGKNQLVHMNDATAFAGRTLVAILENYQQEDGSVMVPEVLRPFMGGRTVIK